MKLATMATMAAMAVIAAANGVSAQGKSQGGRQVTVYLCDNNLVPFTVESQAQGLASQMFAGIGVTVHWRVGEPPPSETNAIAIEFVGNTPAALKPGALAYALPYEGVHIRIFWDRMQANRFPPQVLAHVMVHEIAHILQGIPRHSAEGIMKARWTHDDHAAMEFRPLHFTPEDVELIYEGMNAREAHMPRSATLKATAAAVEAATE